MSSTSIKTAPLRLEKTIPEIVLGIRSATPCSGMEGTLDWLKKEHIHKYWPFFSNLTYTQMISITEENIDFYLKCCGATQEMCQGPKKKIAKSIQGLRDRTENLRKLCPMKFKETCCTIMSILKTPLSEIDLEEDGTDLVHLIKVTITKVVDLSRDIGIGEVDIEPMLLEYVKHPSIPEYDKICAKVWLDYIQNDTFYCPDLIPSHLFDNWRVYANDKKMKKKIEKLTRNLKQVCEILNQLNPSNYQKTCSVLYTLLKNPISQLHFSKQTGVIHKKITQVVEFIRNYGKGMSLIKPVLEEYVIHESAAKYDKQTAEEWLEHIENNTFYYQ